MEKHKRKYLSHNGITIISLAVTIIILIILAGVSLNLILGENGLIGKAKETEKIQDIARISEKLELEKGKVAIENEYTAKVNRIYRTYQK